MRISEAVLFANLYSQKSCKILCAEPQGEDLSFAIADQIVRL